MGRVISIRDFSADENIGSVGLKNYDKFLAVNITGPTSIISADNTAKLGLAFIPADTEDKAVAWSIVSGSEYASIDNEGNITIKEGANDSEVIVRVQSLVYDIVSDKAAIKVTYNAPSVALSYIETGEGNYVDTGVSPKDIDYISMTINVTQTDKETAFMGAQPSKYRYFQLSQQGGGKTLRMFDCMYLKGYMQYANISPGEHTIEYDMKSFVFKLDGETIPKTAATGSYDVTNNIYLYAINLGGTATAAPGSNGSGTLGIKSFKAMKDGKTLADMSAVLYNGKARFWDDVHKQYIDIVGDSEISYKK